MNNLLLILVLLAQLLGGIFLLLPYLTSKAYNVVLLRTKAWGLPLNITLGRVLGLIISVASIILLYQTL